MAVSEIITLAECLSYAGKGSSATDVEIGQANMLKRGVERAVRRYVGSSITQETYTHFFPQGNPFDLRAGRGLSASVIPVGVQTLGPTIRLPEWPIRSVTSLYEDEAANFGTTSGSFPASSELTEGEDFTVNYDHSGIGRRGELIRLDRNWYATPGSYKITYVAGWSDDELAGNVTDPNLDVTDIRIAVMKTFAEFFNEMVNQQTATSGSTGPVKSERLGDYAVTYDTEHSGSSVHLPKDVKDLLRPYRRFKFFQ